MLFTACVIYLYLQQTGKQCLDHYVKLKYLDTQPLKRRSKIKDDGIEFLGRYLKIKFA
ncbi:hypothetical protein BN1088_1431748 [Sphingobacterium sp. PM2-P1-29]|nr:hypothetical protein BN1088_1431748 [Sphingobacterium sp. PM2-P1-29]